MISLLARLFIKEEMNSERKRETYGIICGALGIGLNIILFAIKLFAGLLSGAVSIVADAINNLSDAGSSLVSLVGFKLAGQKADSKHPYGHGRIEYVATFVVSAAILVMGFELFKESVVKIIHPAELEYSITVVIILLVSIAVKAYMAMYNYSVGKKIDSSTMLAVAKDSVSDCIATLAVLAATLLHYMTDINLDGYAGIAVSLFVFYSGYSSIKEAIDPLLGTPPKKEYIEKIERTVLDFDENIVGIHDLMIHDYGPGRKIISLHAEVPSDGDIMALHDIVDNLERTLNSELGCTTTIHMDPVDIHNPEVKKLKEEVSKLVKEIHEGITIHDFRVVWGDTHTNLIFDMLIPFDCKVSPDEAKKTAEKLISDRIGNNYYSVIEVDIGNI